MSNSDTFILCGYFALASEQNWIHEQNFVALTREYRDLYAQLSKKEDITPNRDTPDSPAEAVAVKPQQTQKATPVRAVASIDINDRQKKILAYMKSNPESPFGPVVELFDGISSRTVRRDLDVLVRGNLLVREGNTSSSLYKLA